MSTKDSSRRQPSVQNKTLKSSAGKPNLQVTTSGHSKRFMSSQSQHDLISSSDQCIFCQKLQTLQTQNFGQLLTKALYAKYSSSQNYYYSKDINDILDQETTTATINYRDLEIILEDEEYLKRIYLKKELKGKKFALLEYYKYHKDIPRLFMQNIYSSINRFHDKRRRLEYARIKRNLGLPDDDEHTKHLTHDHKRDKKGSRDLSVQKLGNLLKGVNLDVSMKPKSKSVKQKEKDQTQNHSLSFHLNDLLTTINNQKVIQITKPISEYQIGIDLSIFEQSLQIFNKPFEDISTISISSKQTKGVSYEEFRSNIKKKTPALELGQINVPTMNFKDIRKASLSPEAKTSIALLANSYQIKQQTLQLSKSKTNIIVQQPGSQTERVKQVEQVFKTDQLRVNNSKPKESVQMQSHKTIEQIMKLQNQQRIQIISNSIDHFSSQPQTQTISRANSNYSKQDQITRPYGGSTINSPNRAILKSNIGDQQIFRSNNSTQSKNPSNKIETNFDVRITTKNTPNVIYQSTSNKNLANSIIQFDPKTIMQQAPQFGRTRSQDHAPVPVSIPVPVYVKGGVNFQRPPSTHRPSKSEIFNLVDPKKFKAPQNYANNVYLPGGQKKTPSYTINHNNIVNIYLNDTKSQLKANKTNGGSQTSRGVSPPKFNRKIFDCEIPVQKK